MPHVSTAAAAALADGRTRFAVASGAFDELLDRVWDMGGGPVSWGAAPGRKVWVGFHGPDRWEEVHGPTLDFCAMALKGALRQIVADIDGAGQDFKQAAVLARATAVEAVPDAG